MRVAAILASALIAGLPTNADARPCMKWGAPVQAGLLDDKIIDEASGLEASANFPGRLYHDNDSGDDLRFFMTDIAGGGTQIVNLKGPKPSDIEEMSLGPCGKHTCLYLGDIGDNWASRPEISFTLVEEKKLFAETETPLRVIRARYPDGPHNAEAFAITPKGDLILVTKAADAKATNPGPALVFKLSANQLAQTEGVQVFTRIGEIDLPHLLPDQAFYGWLTTGLDIAADGRAVLLTYTAMLELDFDLAQGVPPTADWKLGETWNVLKPTPLQQQEAIAWLPDASGFLYDTETGGGNRNGPARLMKVMCETP